MSLDRRLRRHFDALAGRLPEPPDRLDAVVRAARRRRAVRQGAALAAAAVIVLALPFVIAGLSRTIELEPVPPADTGEPGSVSPTAGPSPSPTPPPSPDPEATPDPTPSPTGRPPDEPSPTAAPEDPVPAGQLGAAVLVYGPADQDPLRRVDRNGEEELWSGPVDVALPDGDGGVVLQPATEEAVLWLPDPAGGDPVRLAETDRTLLLRGVLPDGRALYSVRPPDEEITEGDTEEFFAVDLAEGAQPEATGSRMAYESWQVGPVAAAGGQLVHASCHAHCNLWPGLTDGAADADMLYQGLSIEGLAATPDGRVVAFVEFDITLPDASIPELVLLDGASFDELARIELPLEDGQVPGTPVVSLSADGQRVLVTLGAGTPQVVPPGVPTTPYLVEGALTGQPGLRPVDATGVVRWVDPVAASGQGGPVSAAEHRAAEALLAFARAPGADTLAEVPLAPSVGLGLGPDLLTERVAGELADPQAWSLEPAEGHFRAYAGPFSALDLLSRADEVQIAGGPHRHCAGAPMPAPPGLAEARRVSIQPAAPDGCLEWWTVDLFVDGDGEVVAVTLDLWEP